MKHSNIPSAQTVVQHCKAKGIRNIVISPGSRNAPLTIGFTHDPFFKCFSIVDERCAAFFALGIAQQLREPAAVVCTSGSALLNYYPAVAEAFYSDIPVVVISADRPSYKIDVGDGQTIRQDDVFQRHIGYSANLKQDVVHATDSIRRYAPQLIGRDSVENAQNKVQEFNDTELNKALNIALKVKLPVHINVPFEEPLYDTLKKPITDPLLIFPKNEGGETINLDEFIKIWNSSKRKMVLVGVNYPNTVEPQFCERLAADPSIIVFTETTSNLHHPHFFPSIDSIVAPIEKSGQKDILFNKLKPEVLLTFGGMIVSKKIKAFLREYKPKHHWHVDDKKAYDTFFGLSHHFRTDVNSFFARFLGGTKKLDSDYFPFWSGVKSNYIKRREAYLSQIQFSDMLVFHHVTSSVPKNYQVQLANSSAVRYAQLFNMHPSCTVFCNRGTSGIDGSTSTAIGASIYSENPTVLLTGDLSFFYDSNGLWNNYIRSDFRIILINNKGGGIFRILPGKENTKNFEDYFETVHTLDAKHLCEQYSVEYHKVTDAKGLKTCLSTFYNRSKSPKLLEVRTPRKENNKILLAYFDFISSKHY